MYESLYCDIPTGKAISIVQSSSLQHGSSAGPHREIEDYTVFLVVIQMTKTLEVKTSRTRIFPMYSWNKLSFTNGAFVKIRLCIEALVKQCFFNYFKVSENTEGFGGESFICKKVGSTGCKLKVNLNLLKLKQALY